MNTRLGRPAASHGGAHAARGALQGQPRGSQPNTLWESQVVRPIALDRGDRSLPHGATVPPWQIGLIALPKKDVWCAHSSG